jgi:hypothetical protein
VDEGRRQRARQKIADDAGAARMVRPIGHYLRRRVPATTSPTPATITAAPAQGGIATRSRCLTEALSDPI